MSNFRGSPKTALDPSPPAVSKSSKFHSRRHSMGKEGESAGVSRSRSHRGGSKERKSSHHHSGLNKDDGKHNSAKSHDGKHNSAKSHDDKHKSKHKRSKNSEEGGKSAKSVDDKHHSNKHHKKDKKAKDEKDKKKMLNITTMVPNNNSASASNIRDKGHDTSADRVEVVASSVNALSKKDVRKLKKEMQSRTNDQTMEIHAKDKKSKVKKVKEETPKEELVIKPPIVDVEIIPTPAPVPEKVIKFADDDSPLIFNTVIASSDSFDDVSSYVVNQSSSSDDGGSWDSLPPTIVKTSSNSQFAQSAAKAPPVNYMTQLHKATMLRRQKTRKTEVAFQMASSSSEDPDRVKKEEFD